MSSVTNITGGFVNDTTAARQIAPKAVLFQVLLMSGISLATLLAFEILRPNNKRVYQPKVKYYVGNKRPPNIAAGPLSWISPLIHTKEPELLDKVGLDAVAFLRFLRMLRWLFASIAVVACAVLLPINITYNLKNVDSNQRDVLSMMTIANVRGNILFAHVAVSYAICAIVMAFVYLNWQKMVELRRTWFRSPEYMQSFYARTLMVTNVPKKMQSDQGLQSLFQSLQVPYPTTDVSIGRRVGQLPDLIDYHNDTVRELETVLVRYLKNGKIGKKRPVVTQGGFLGIGGKKVDAIDFYTEKLKRVEAHVLQWRETIDTRKAEIYGFASMAAVPYAHIVAAQLRRKRKNGAIISLAPNPKDIVWENLNASQSSLARKRTLGWVYLVLFCAFNTVPLLAISVLANLQSLAIYVKFIGSWAQASPTTFALISGVLPSSVMAIFAVLFPVVLRRLSRYQGADTNSRLDRAVVARYFAFLIISQLVIFTLIGVIFNSVRNIVVQIGKHQSFQQIIDNLHTLPSTINSTYIQQSSYWMTWFPLRGFLFIFDLAQILNLVWVTVKTHLFGRTPRDIREWTQPPEFEYATYYANLLFMSAVALVFAPLAPLVAALAAIVFIISSFVYKYQLMFVFTTKVESGGRIWNSVINRLLVSLIFMQLLMTLTIGLQIGFRTFEWLSTLPPLIFIVAFKWHISRRFMDQFRYYIPSSEEIANAKVHSERADTNGHRLEKRFGHPALHAELFTPMVHAKMTHLLSEVYQGRLGTTETRMKEFGGAKMETQVAPGGIRIAAIEQRDLEYDPVLYQRDRGEIDSDTRSISSNTYLSDTASMYKAGTSSPAPRPAGYDDYLSRGPQRSQEFELAQFRSRDDQAPLLPPNLLNSPPEFMRSDSNFSYPNMSQYSLNLPPGGRPYSPHQYPPEVLPPSQNYNYPQAPSRMQGSPSGDGQALREAPVQRYQRSDSQPGNFAGVGAGFRR